MYKLKLVTTIAFIFGIALLVSWLFVLGPKPETRAPKTVIAEYAVKSLIYFGLTALSLLTSSVGAYLILKKQREEFAAEHLKIVKGLVDGSLNDHAAKVGADSSNAPSKPNSTEKL